MKFIKKLWNASIVAVFGLLVVPLAYVYCVTLEISVDIANSVYYIAVAICKLRDKLRVEL